MQRFEHSLQKLENWNATSIRALSGQANVQYRGHCLIVNGMYHPVYSPHLNLNFSTLKTNEQRGISDSIALRLMHSNEQFHQQTISESFEHYSVAYFIFDLLEQLRCEALVSASLPGSVKNVHARFLYWADQTRSSPVIENDISLLVYSLSVVVWSRLTRQAIPEQIEDAIEHTRWGVAKELGPDLRTLKTQIDDQQSYSETAVSIANMISEMIHRSQPSTEDNDLKVRSILKLINPALISVEELNQIKAKTEINAGDQFVTRKTIKKIDTQYSIFSVEHDKTSNISQLIRQSMLDKFRLKLDKLVRLQTVNIAKVSRYLQQVVSIQDEINWTSLQDEGVIDSSRLSQIVTSQNIRNIFKKPHDELTSNCAISILIDNSGSMKNYREALALSVDTLARIFNLANINFEILGFTTTQWNGGKVYQQWLSEQKPKNPGRLNATQHIVYKSFKSTWRRSRKGISGLLRSDLYKESVDGEALDWAYSRIKQNDEKNKIIIVISDGSPNDSATNNYNEDDLLDQHLISVSSKIERDSNVHLCALGIGLDLSAYYQHNLSINLQENVTTNNYFDIVKLINQSLTT